MVRVRLGRRQICRRCHRFPGTVHRPQGNRDTAQCTEGNASGRASARSWQPRRLRNRPLDRWLCVPVFRRVCPYHRAKCRSGAPRSQGARVWHASQVVFIHTLPRCHLRPRPRLCSVPRRICNAVSGLPGSPRREERAGAASIARVRRFPHRCSAADHDDPSEASRAWQPLWWQPVCHGARHVAQRGAD